MTHAIHFDTPYPFQRSSHPPQESLAQGTAAFTSRTICGIVGAGTFFSAAALAQNSMETQTVRSLPELLAGAVILGTLSATCTTTKKAATCFGAAFALPAFLLFSVGEGKIWDAGEKRTTQVLDVLFHGIENMKRQFMHMYHFRIFEARAAAKNSAATAAQSAAAATAAAEASAKSAAASKTSEERVIGLEHMVNKAAKAADESAKAAQGHADVATQSLIANKSSVKAAASSVIEAKNFAAAAAATATKIEEATSRAEARIEQTEKTITMLNASAQEVVTASVTKIRKDHQDSVTDSLTKVGRNHQDAVTASVTKIERNHQDAVTASLTKVGRNHQDAVTASLTKIERNHQDAVTASLTKIEKDHQADAAHSVVKMTDEHRKAMLAAIAELRAEHHQRLHEIEVEHAQMLAKKRPSLFDRLKERLPDFREHSSTLVKDPEE